MPFSPLLSVPFARSSIVSFIFPNEFSTNNLQRIGAPVAVLGLAWMPHFLQTFSVASEPTHSTPSLAPFLLQVPGPLVSFCRETLLSQQNIKHHSNFCFVLLLLLRLPCLSPGFGICASEICLSTWSPSFNVVVTAAGSTLFGPCCQANSGFYSISSRHEGSEHG